MATIASLAASEILNAKGNPAVEVKLTLDSGITAIASCPSGTSAGTHEALELLDQDQKRFSGKGVLHAVNNIETIIQKELVGKDVSEQKKIDEQLFDLDGTENKSHLGANAMLAVSIACAKAAAKNQNVETYKYIAHFAENTACFMPKPLCNLINGGLHAGGNLDVQEFMVIPVGSSSFANALENVVTINNALRKKLIQDGFTPLIGDEGGFAPTLESNRHALDMLSEVIQQTGMSLGKDMMLGMDVAASSFFKNGLYTIKDNPLSMNAIEIGSFYTDLISKYRILYLEDPFAEDDLTGWSSFAKIAPEETIVTGDDLTVTNPKRLTMATEKNMIRGIIIKPNQIGTVTEAIATVKQAKKAGIKIIVSHRSGETNDDFIADFAIGVGADFVKFGAPVRGERVAKYNRLLEIERELVISH